MTSPWPSPPRSKKASSDARDARDVIDAEPVEAADIEKPAGKEIVTAPDVTGPDPGLPERAASESSPPADAEPSARDLRAEARDVVARKRDEARATAARQREEAKQTARRAKQEARRERAEIRASKRDRIVEAPREPKAPIGQRLRRAASRSDGPSAASPSRGGRRRILSVLAAVLGAVGLICSVVLAVGALLVALGSVDGTFYDTAASICDALVGPLRDVFSFSGANADMKESLVAWGTGSIGYLVVGVVAQSLLRSVAED